MKPFQTVLITLLWLILFYDGKKLRISQFSIFSLRFLLLSSILFIFLLQYTYSQNLYNSGSKKGGICFRTDDNQPTSHFLEYATIFNNYNQKFSFSINLGGNEITSEYLNVIRQLQASGHEMMDHTPGHNTHCFNTVLDPNYYLNHPGVHRISGSRIELDYTAVDISRAKRSGYVNINGNIVTGTNGIFSTFSVSDCYLYFPTINQLVFICPSCWIDPNNVFISDFWYNNVWIGPFQNIRFYNFDYDNIHITIDGLQTLGEESLRLADYYNLGRPYTWIQPGGYFPHVYSNEIKQSCGDMNGFIAGDSDNDFGLKVFNEHNPNNDRQFGMSWGGFHEDTWDINYCKQVIANGIAKHRVLVGHSHFTGGELLGGWSGFLYRTELLLQWCIQNNIPIRTYSEWADILYNQIPNPYENICPPLNVDLDGDYNPDGYDLDAEGILKSNDGFPTLNDYCYSINHVGKICSVTDLGGVEKGENDFEVHTKGDPGNYVEIAFKVGNQNLIYKFPAENSEWTEYHIAQSVNGNTTLYIPDDISLIDITLRCSNFNTGEVKISGMKLCKYQPVPIELYDFNAVINHGTVLLKWSTISEINNYGFEVERKIGGREEVVGSWKKIGFIPGNGNSNSPKDYFFVDKNPIGGSKFNYRLKQIDDDGKFKYSDQLEIELLPNLLELYQNYPNPFNPITDINFVLPKTVKITLSVYDILGEKIVTLLKEEKEAGYYHVQFDASSFSNGVYILRLNTQDLVQTRKMILMK